MTCASALILPSHPLSVVFCLPQNQVPSQLGCNPVFQLSLTVVSRILRWPHDFHSLYLIAASPRPRMIPSPSVDEL